ncbi:hypothetical protein G7Y79_00027g060210 [Physcia stellaris]|nr:hypothetical protein G7Y79_00027g060210 [Physcia stellaris]
MVFAELAEVEKRFEALEIEILRTSYIKSKPIYADRARLIKQVPGFWPTILQSDDAPPAIEPAIQSCDLQILSSLKAIEIARFEVDDDPSHGDPRSFKITFQFDHNDYFENEALEKTFWHRRSKDGSTGLVSEPVKIKWKKNMDPTEGLLDLAVDAFNEDSNGRLVDRLEESDSSSPSFFAFFGYRGRSITAAESAKVMDDQSKGSEGGSATNLPKREQESPEEDLTSIIKRTISTDENQDDPLVHEIYPAGDDLAIAICEDLFPGALRYFAQASEQEIESDDEDVEEINDDVSEDSTAAEGPPRKRKK